MAGKKGTQTPGETGIPAIDFGIVVIDSPLRFIIQSSKSLDEAHLVDLEEMKLNGECTCEHFAFRIRPGIKTGRIKLHTEGSRCKHIRRAREIVAEAAIRNVAAWLQKNRRARNMEEPE